MARGDDAAPGFWSLALPVGRIFGIDVRLHWTLLLLTVIEVVDLAKLHPPWWFIPVALAVVPVSVLLHEFGHALTARAVGGDSRDIVLWAYGGIAWTSIPGRWAAHLLVAAGGPAVNLAIWGGCLAAVQLGLVVSATPVHLLDWIGRINLVLLLFNLLPCYPMDGGRIARSLLWPLVGRHRAVLWTVYLAYLCLAGLLVWGIVTGSFILAVLAVLMLFTVLGEHRLARAGIDSELGAEFIPERRASWVERWRARRAARAADRAARQAAAEQAELDRLLAKVSAGGLPALTPGERRTLQRISERERERSGR